MAELEELEQEEPDNNFLVIGGLEIASLPNVFSVALLSKPTKKEEEGNDMKELENLAGSM